MKKILVVTALISAIAIPTAVFAAKHAGKMGDEWVEHMFLEHDADKNGTLSKGELPERFQKHFQSADKNNDGQLSKEEAIQAHNERREKRMSNMLMKFDTNSDGLVSKSELISFVEKKFAKLDENGDEQLSMEELSKMKKMMRGGHHHKKDKS
jgi:Ca2+-binding EF-hand superfamily protein